MLSWREDLSQCLIYIFAVLSYIVYVPSRSSFSVMLITEAGLLDVVSQSRRASWVSRRTISLDVLTTLCVMDSKKMDDRLPSLSLSLRDGKSMTWYCHGREGRCSPLWQQLDSQCPVFSGHFLANTHTSRLPFPRLVSRIECPSASSPFYDALGLQSEMRSRFETTTSRCRVVSPLTCESFCDVRCVTQINYANKASVWTQENIKVASQRFQRMCPPQFGSGFLSFLCCINFAKTVEPLSRAVVFYCF